MKKIILIFVMTTIATGAGVLLSSQITPTLERIPPVLERNENIPTLIETVAAAEKLLLPRPGTEKYFYFPDLQRIKAKNSLVYLHGFSASRREVSPLFENLSREFKYPLFMTRFAGHGLGADELGQTQLKDWLNDAVEAYEIGLSLGDEVLIGCSSTGCALAIYLAFFYPEKIKAMVMLSPNFGLADRRAFLANGPLGPLITKLVAGEYREFHGVNSQAKYYWTTKYRTSVIPELVGLVSAVKKLDWSKIKIPILTLYTPHDEVVSGADIESNLRRLGGHHNSTIALSETRNHILAGDIQNPTMTARVLELIREFLTALP